MKNYLLVFISYEEGERERERDIELNKWKREGKIPSRCVHHFSAVISIGFLGWIRYMKIVGVKRPNYFQINFGTKRNEEKKRWIFTDKWYWKVPPAAMTRVEKIWSDTQARIAHKIQQFTHIKLKPYILNKNRRYWHWDTNTHTHPHALTTQHKKIQLVKH